MNGALFMKRAFLVAFLGGAVVAACALPGYETDPSLSGSTASSSGTSSTSGGGKNNTGGAGGTADTGGAGGTGGSNSSGVQPIVCKNFLDANAILGAECTDYVVQPGTPGAVEQCPFGRSAAAKCCVETMECVFDPVLQKSFWQQSAIPKNCVPRDLNCPVGCFLEPDAKTCPAGAPTTVNTLSCPCFNADPTKPDMSPPPPLPVCLFEPAVCDVNQQATYPVLGCAPTAMADNPIGNWHIFSSGCCVPGQMGGAPICMADPNQPCKPFATLNGGDMHLICKIP